MTDSIAWPSVVASPTVRTSSQENRVPASWLPSTGPSEGKKRKHPIRTDMLLVFSCLAGTYNNQISLSLSKTLDLEAAWRLISTTANYQQLAVCERGVRHARGIVSGHASEQSRPLLCGAAPVCLNRYPCARAFGEQNTNSSAPILCPWVCAALPGSSNQRLLMHDKLTVSPTIHRYIHRLCIRKERTSRLLAGRRIGIFHHDTRSRARSTSYPESGCQRRNTTRIFTWTYPIYRNQTTRLD